VTARRALTVALSVAIVIATDSVAIAAGSTRSVVVVGNATAADASVVSRTCSLPHGAEGGFALPFSVAGIGCSAAIPVVKDVIYSGGPCNGANLTSSGCRAALGFKCRIPSPISPGYADPGDKAVCVKRTERIEVYLPG